MRDRLFDGYVVLSACACSQSADVVVREHGPDHHPHRHARPRVLLPFPPVSTFCSPGEKGAHLIYVLFFSHAIATILCFGALGALATAFISTLGPKTGLRTMVITRFSSGYVGCAIYSVLNILTQCVAILRYSP